MKTRIAGTALLAIVALLLSISTVAQMGKGDDAKAVAEITKIENDSVKADLANDASFYDRILADDYTAGHSYGTTENKQQTLAAMKDTANNKMNSRSIANLNVRVYGDTAIATYEDTYDSVIDGKPLARTVISTDTFVRQNGVWKEVAGHSSVKAEKAAMTH
jgi:Domain of unknown function (DUF4440)